MKLRTLLIVAALAATAAVFGVAARQQIQPKPYKHPAFTLVYQVKNVDPTNSEQTVEGEETRHVFSDGSFYVRFEGVRGERHEYFFKRGLGVFEIDHKRRQLIKDSKVSPEAGRRPAQTADEMLKDPQFLQTETVLGMTAYVMRVKDDQTGMPITDLYFAEETGKAPLKTVDYGGKGTPVIIAEPIRITFGEPNPGLLVVPSYSIVDKP